MAFFFFLLFLLLPSLSAAEAAYAIPRSSTVRSERASPDVDAGPPPVLSINEGLWVDTLRAAAEESRQEPEASASPKTLLLALSDLHKLVNVVQDRLEERNGLVELPRCLRRAGELWGDLNVLQEALRSGAPGKPLRFRVGERLVVMVDEHASLLRARLVDDVCLECTEKMLRKRYALVLLELIQMRVREIQRALSEHEPGSVDEERVVPERAKNTPISMSKEFLAPASNSSSDGDSEEGTRVMSAKARYRRSGHAIFRWKPRY